MFFMIPSVTFSTNTENVTLYSTNVILKESIVKVILMTRVFTVVFGHEFRNSLRNQIFKEQKVLAKRFP